MVNMKRSFHVVSCLLSVTEDSSEKVITRARWPIVAEWGVLSINNKFDLFWIRKGDPTNIEPTELSTADGFLYLLAFVMTKYEFSSSVYYSDWRRNCNASETSANIAQSCKPKNTNDSSNYVCLLMIST